MGPSPPGASSVRGWSAAVGANQSKIIDLLVANAVNLAAVAGAVLLLVADSMIIRGLGLVLALACVAALGWLLRRETSRHGELLGLHLGSRLVLLIAAAAALLARWGEQTDVIWVGAGIALTAVLAEPTIKVLLAKTQQIAVNLPGVTPVPTPPYPPDWLTSGTLGVIVAGLALALGGAPAWTFVLVTLAQLVGVLIIIGYAVRANRATRRALTTLPKALKAYRPAFAVYYGGTHGARYQLGMWLPYLERLGMPFVVITREAETVPTITGLTSAPVIVPRTTSALGDLGSLVVPSMRAAFYVQGSRANLHFQKFRQLTHVWLNHGDSDKQANFSPRHATYDKVLVCGQQGVERYAEHGVVIPPDRLVTVGRPQVERIEVRDAVLPPDAPRTVLYAPTWRGGRPSTDYSSLALGSDIVAALIDRGATVIFRPHPLSAADPVDAALITKIQHQLDRDRQRSGRRHVWGRPAEQDWEVADCLNASDALVTDVSSVASDNLASGKPFAMVAVRSTGDAFRAEFPMARVAYVIEKDLSTLDSALDDLLGADPLAEQRRAYRRHCLGDQLGAEAAQEFLRVARAIVTEDRRKVQRSARSGSSATALPDEKPSPTEPLPRGSRDWAELTEADDEQGAVVADSA